MSQVQRRMRNTAIWWWNNYVPWCPSSTVEYQFLKKAIQISSTYEIIFMTFWLFFTCPQVISFVQSAKWVIYFISKVSLKHYLHFRNCTNYHFFKFFIRLCLGAENGLGITKWIKQGDNELDPAGWW